MKRPYVLVLFALLPWAAPAQEPARFDTLPAAEVVVADLMFVKRPLVIFADTPNDPSFIRQMALIARDPASLAERDVVVVTDTDPAAKSALRQKLRPNGFSLVLMDKDWEPEIRKPLPWDVREITHAIDKFPFRRQEMTERPAAAGG